MIQIYSGRNQHKNELSESKDFEQFYQKSLLPKELQKVNPALLGINSGISTPMRALSPIQREITQEEKDLIKIKYDLK